MTTTWFEGNFKTKEKGERYRPAFYATHCDNCDLLLTHDRNKTIAEEREELKEQLVITKLYIEKVKSYKDFNHFCSRECLEKYELDNDIEEKPKE